MFKYSLLLVLASMSLSSFARDTFVHGYRRSNGTYVQPHHRSAPDGNPNNNWSSLGNVNPYTGKVGTKRPQPTVVPTYQVRPYGYEVTTQPKTLFENE
jgi:hypothetical protein